MLDEAEPEPPPDEPLGETVTVTAGSAVVDADWPPSPGEDDP